MFRLCTTYIRATALLFSFSWAKYFHDCGYTFHQGDCPGYDIVQKRFELDQCQDACNKQAACKSFQQRSPYCWLKTYACPVGELQFTNDTMYRQYNKNVCVKDPPDLITISSTKSAMAKNKLETFTCTISGGNPPNPTLTIYREKDGRQPLMTGPGPTIKLKNRRMVKSDNGAKFYCKSSLSGYPSVSKKSNEIVYKVLYPPDLVTLSSMKSAMPVDQLETFTCTISGGNPPNPTLTIYRKKDGKQPLMHGPGPTIVMKDRRMVKSDNGAKFYCESSLSGYPSVSKKSNEIIYSVLYPPDSIILSSKKSTRAINQPETFTCTITGGNPPDPTLIIYREKDGRQQLLKGRGPTVVLKDRIMAKDDNDAKFYCESRKSEYKSLSKKSALIAYTVQYPPDLITLSSTKSARPINQLETFTCNISGGNPPDPTLTIYREKDGRQQLTNGTGPTIVLKDRPMVSGDNGSRFYCESSLSGYQNISKTSNEIIYTILTMKPSLPEVAIIVATISGVILIYIIAVAVVVIRKRKGAKTFERPPACVNELENPVFSDDYVEIGPSHQIGHNGERGNEGIYSEPNDDQPLYVNVGPGRLQSDDQPLYVNVGPGLLRPGETSGNSQSSDGKENTYASLEQAKMSKQPEVGVYESLGIYSNVN